MEQLFSFKTPDNYTIFGTLTSKNKSDKIIVFVHGLGGHQNEHIFFNAAKFFPIHGFDVFRFDLYPGNPGREFKNCTLKNHVEDLEVVLQEISPKYKEIYLVGHSLGGPIILLKNKTNIKKIVLRDPVLDTKKLYKDEVLFDKQKDLYYINRGIDIIMGKSMIDEMQEIPDLNLELNNLCKIIYAEKTDLKDDLKRKDIPFVVILNSSHTFDQEGTEEKLFEETLDWFLE